MEGITCYMDENQGFVAHGGLTATTGSLSGWIISAVGDGWEGWGANDYQYRVNCGAGIASCTAAGGSAAGGAIANVGARHDPTTNTFQGRSEYLMADGHVKLLSFQNVGCLGWSAPANNNLSYSTKTWAMQCGPFDATFNPQ
jgi:prepilin-type processing-associated H-X9-DG protein